MSVQILNSMIDHQVMIKVMMIYDLKLYVLAKR